MRFRSLFPVMAVGLGFLFWNSSAIALEVKSVTSSKGIEAWLVEDHKIPVVSISFSFEGGTAQDPKAKQGLAYLAAHLLDEGAGSYDSQAFQHQLQDNSISMSFDSDRDAFFGSLKTLVEMQDKAADLTRLALTKARFSPEAVARIKASVESQIRQNEKDPDWLVTHTFFHTVFANHSYGQRPLGTLESLQAITQKDLQGFVRQHLTRQRLKVAVCGDIKPENLGPLLDKMFGALPGGDDFKPLPEVVLEGTGKTVVVETPNTQTLIMAGHAGIKRSDPDWFAASLLNYILGGGGFNSRLMNEIREKRGLTYGIRSSLLPLKSGALMTASTATMNASAAEVLDLLRKEWKQVREEGVTTQELEGAKTYLTGSLPLQLDSTEDIAAVLLEVQRDNLGIDYLDRRAGLIQAVTSDDIRRVAQRLLHPENLTVVMVGKPVLKK